MKKRFAQISLLLGIFLAMGPLWGALGAVVGMTLKFWSGSESAAVNAEQLALDMSVAMRAAAIGLLLCPLGIALLVVAVLNLSHLNRHHHQP